MRNKNDQIIRDFLKRAGSKGGKARAARYDKSVLSEWGKKGGRPPKKNGVR